MASLNSITKVDYRTATDYAIRAMVAGLVPFITSDPGYGKSSLANDLAEKLNAEKIDVRLSYREPTDIGGYPNINEAGKAYYAPFESMFPLEGTPLPKGKNGWLIVLDEFPSCTVETQAAAYQLILDRMVGQYKLHKDVAIICLGNDESSGAIVNPIYSAMNSRLVHIKLRLDAKQWIEDFAIPNGIDSRIIGYISYRPQALCDFNPDTSGSSFTCPRTLEFLSKLIKGTKDLNYLFPLMQGTIAPGVAGEFHNFCKIMNQLPSVDTIVGDPTGSVIPHDLGARWGAITMLADEVNDVNIESIFKYIKRMDKSMQSIFVHMVLTKMPSAISLSFVREIASDVGRVLSGN